MQYMNQYYDESIAEGIWPLRMLQIPGGSFVMGSPDDEIDHCHDEAQHRVTVAPFAMGQFPVTQAQWRAVATMPRVNRNLDPDPAYFKGDNRPVEQVSWYDAIEFCKRISAHTCREYRLPRDAEWEYACRAGTTTLFNFGDTITSDLANYDGMCTFAFGPKGEYREQTTDVGSFPANAFGLYDMHGNVWEWCLDRYSRIENGDLSRRILRGGSWSSDPHDCRSTVRYGLAHDLRFYVNGFRVCVSVN